MTIRRSSELNHSVKRASFLIGSSLAGIAAATIATSAMAQNATTSPGDPTIQGQTPATQTTATSNVNATSTNTSSAAPTGGDIIVTARKRSEKLQNVPLAITALTGADLQAAGVQDLRDITFQTPGLTFTTGAGANYFSKPIIRGQTDLGSGDNNVPVFFDGIYISNTSAIDFDMIDLARVEVIKGPVSATYGRSAYAGAINYVTAKPSDKVVGQVQATGGNYGKYDFSARISGPIAGDVLKGGISGTYDHFDGTYHDDATHQDAGGYVKRDVLANLDFTPDDHLEIRPVVYYGNDKFDSSPTVFAPANCGVSPGLGSYSASFCGKFPSGTTFGPFVAAPGNYGATGNTRKVFIANVQASLTYDWGTITSLTGYGHYKTNEYNEFDDQSFGTLTSYYALPAGATVGSYPTAANAATFGKNAAGQVDTPLHFGYADKNIDFSQELRVSTPQTAPLRFSLGGYYATSKHSEDLNLARGTCSVPTGYYIVDFFAVPCGQTKSAQQTAYTKHDTIKAVFGSADWDVTRTLTLSEELRYSSTSSRYLDEQAIFTPFPAEGYSTSQASSLYPIGPDALKASFHSVTSRSSITYKPTPELTIYASAANGDKIGGFNNNTSYPTYKPETNWTYEIGVKSSLFDRRLDLTADVYYIDASNYQIYGPPPGAAQLGGFINTNYGGLQTKGFEASASFALTKWARLSGGLAYTDPKFKGNAYDFGDVALCGAIASCAGRLTTVGPNPAISLKGLRPPYESNFTFNAALDIHYPLGDNLAAIFRLDYRHESKQYYQYPIDTGFYGPLNSVNLRIGVEKGKVSLIGYIRNLTNDKTPETVQDTAVTGGTGFQTGYYPVAVLPDRRNVGATLTWKFGG